MVRGRIELTPSEQLVELRKARDRYAAMADHLKANPGPAKLRQENRLRERDARRIADAYDKSIANMTSKMLRAGPAHSSWLGDLGVARPLFALAVGGLALVALLYPGILETGRLHAGPAAKPMPAVAINTGQDAPNAAKMEKSDQDAKRPPVAPKPTLSPEARRAADALRPRPVVEQVRPAPRIAKPAPRAFRTNTGEGFVAKVLQPDGSLK